jgi:hypothetical protein
MKSSHVALVIASHHGLLLNVTVPYSSTSHYELQDGESNAPVKKNVSLGFGPERVVSTWVRSIS